MVDHLIDAALYLHEALVDGYEVAPAFLDPAISVRDGLWPKFKNTQLAFVLTDAVAALETAKLAKTESEVQAALEKLIGALKPWILEVSVLRVESQLGIQDIDHPEQLHPFGLMGHERQKFFLCSGRQKVLRRAAHT